MFADKKRRKHFLMSCHRNSNRCQIIPAGERESEQNRMCGRKYGLINAIIFLNYTFFHSFFACSKQIEHVFFCSFICFRMSFFRSSAIKVEQIKRNVAHDLLGNSIKICAMKRTFFWESLLHIILNAQSEHCSIHRWISQISIAQKVVENKID